MDGHVGRWKNEVALEESIMVLTQRRAFVKQVEFVRKTGACPILRSYWHRAGPSYPEEVQLPPSH